jgi:hypothetical protein
MRVLLGASLLTAADSLRAARAVDRPMPAACEQACRELLAVMS